MKKLLHLSARVLLVALACCFSLTAYAQKLSIKGTVTDENGEPLFGASVVVMSGKTILGGEQLPTYQVVTLSLLNLDNLLRFRLSVTNLRPSTSLLRRQSTL